MLYIFANMCVSFGNVHNKNFLFRVGQQTFITLSSYLFLLLCVLLFCHNQNVSFLLCRVSMILSLLSKVRYLMILPLYILPACRKEYVQLS